MNAVMGLRRLIWTLGFSALGLVLMGAVSECGTETKREIYEGELELVHEHYMPRWAEGGTSIVLGYFGALYVVAADGSNLRRFSKVSRDNEEFDLDYSPDVSPDGTRIAYTTLRHSTGSAFNRVHSFEIVTSALDGSDVRRLTENESLETNPVWSPDGSRIAFLSDRENYDGTFKLYTMAADGSDVRSVAPSVRAFGDPAVWSPNGEMLAFYALEEPDSEDGAYKSVLYTVRSDGSDLARLSEADLPRMIWATPSLPTWSSDSLRIAFVQQQEDGASYVMDPDGGNPRKVVDDGRTEAPYWSPDGSELRFVATQDVPIGENSYRKVTGVHAIKTDGSGLQMMAELEHPGLTAWSPDGSRIAVRVETTRLNGDSNVVLYTVARDGSDMRVLVRKGLGGNLIPENSVRRPVTHDIAACSEGFVVPKPEKNPGLVQDCETLLSIRDTLIGEEAALPWGADTPISRWTGVEVGGRPTRVVSLRLERLAGTIPPELGNLMGLKTLNLTGNNAGGNNLTGPIPSELGNLLNLEWLGLFGSLSGSIPSELGNLTNLTLLGLSNNQLTGSIPSELGNLTNLTHLGLADNQLTGSIPRELGRLRVLEHLSLEDNNLSGGIPSELGGLANLYTLGLDRNSFSGCMPASLLEHPTLRISGSELEPC